MNLAQRIDLILPQTQCRECGYEGCLPYAEALAAGSADTNLCAPGGEAVMLDIAGLLGQTPAAPPPAQAPALAWIDEAVCIGCTACIRACPVDAIMGASKLMHTVLADECTGCGLCVAPCPVDCIHMQPVETEHLPRARLFSHSGSNRFAAAEHARARFRFREQRKAREAESKRRHLAERAAAQQPPAAADNPPAAQSAFNPASLIAQAMARAQAQQNRRTIPANREAYQAQQLAEAQERAAYRRAQRDLQYGSEAEKAAALAYLRQYKAEQEAKAARNADTAPSQPDKTV